MEASSLIPEDCYCAIVDLSIQPILVPANLALLGLFCTVKDRNLLRSIFQRPPSITHQDGKRHRCIELPLSFLEIYAAVQEVVSTNFLQWHLCNGGCTGQIYLVHSISTYFPWMGRTGSLWDDLAFASKGDVTCRAVGCSNWLPMILHPIGAAI